MSKILFAVLCTIISASAAAESIVVLGDSISAGYGIEARDGWVSLLQKKLQVEKFPYQIFNESISGDTSAGGLARIGIGRKRRLARLDAPTDEIESG